MKTISLAAVTQKDLKDAISIVTSGNQCRIYYLGDEVPVVPVDLAFEQEALLAQYDAALMAHYDRVAGARNYDSYISATMRAGYEGPFQAEGTAFAQWMDGCNVLGYQLIADVKAGRKPLPTIDAFIAGLPAMVWP